MKQVNVIFLGCGNIGGGVFRLLQMNAAGIAHREGMQFNIVGALVRSVNKPRPEGFPTQCLTTSFDELLAKPDVQLAAEFLGGVEPASTYMETLLRRGVSVVTANKEAIAHNWPRLEAAARAGGAGLYFEASVCGGIPVIKSLYSSLQANDIQQVKGIINGTTNYMLCRMSQGHLDYSQALEEAQAKGYAEPDPTNDVGGGDAACKLSILSSIAFHTKVPLEDIFREGITGITPQDIETGRELGYDIKMLAIGKKHEDRVEARVHPTFLPLDHPLTAVKDSYNAVYVTGNAVGNLMYYGKGAGDLPTASAMVSDMVTAARTAHHRYNTFANTEGAPAEMPIAQDWTTRFYLRMTALDMPGVLAAMAGVLAHHGISIATCSQKGYGHEQVPIVLITHPTWESAMRQAVCELAQLPQIKQVDALIRVEE
ncbi:MAG: homoserine dehydrogenase [Eubacteriales bacterium]|nr:homoserine dehydrogenase [Eubacteriales bacterium]